MYRLGLDEETLKSLQDHLRILLTEVIDKWDTWQAKQEWNFMAEWNVSTFIF